jgi:hypothetical protein
MIAYSILPDADSGHTVLPVKDILPFAGDGQTLVIVSKAGRRSIQYASRNFTGCIDDYRTSSSLVQHDAHFIR